MLVLACGRGGRAGLVHTVHRLCRGAELRSGSGRADLIDQGSVRFIVGEPPRTVEDRKPAVRGFVNAHGRLDEVAAVALLGDLQHTTLVTDPVVVPPPAACLEAKDGGEPPPKGPEPPPFLGSRDPETGVWAWDVNGGEAVVGHPDRGEPLLTQGGGQGALGGAQPALQSDPAL